MRDIDPEGFTRYGGDCVCGPVYTYNGIPEPGQFDPFCPDHGDPEYVATLTVSDVVQRAKQALEGVTEGPWKRLESYNDIHAPGVRKLVFQHDPAPRIEDAEFSATSRSLVPELVSEVERLEALVESLKSELRLNRRFGDNVLAILDGDQPGSLNTGDNT